MPTGQVHAPALRTVVLASPDAGLRSRIRASLIGLRWQVREASGGAEAIAQLEETGAEALLMDSWFPDLDVSEFATQVRSLYPAMDLLRLDGGVQMDSGSARSPRRNELLQAMRESHSRDELITANGKGGCEREPDHDVAPVCIEDFTYDRR